MPNENSYTPISILRGSSAMVDQTPIVDGQILFDEGRKCLYMDEGVTRNKYSGLGADSNVATVEDTTTATHAYVKGNYVVVEGQLYEVTAAIAIGDTFTVGTNIAVTTVGTELSQINSDLTASDDLVFNFTKSGTDYGYTDANGNFVPFRTKHTATYKPTVRATNNDMGLYHNYRYVNTTAVPNANSQTYSVTSNGTKDMGATNDYRYVSVSVKPAVSGVAPSGEASYLATASDTYHNGGAKITLGNATISADGKTITIPETIAYGGYWFARGQAADGTASRNIVITLNI